MIPAPAPSPPATVTEALPQAQVPGACYFILTIHILQDVKKATTQSAVSQPAVAPISTKSDVSDPVIEGYY